MPHRAAGWARADLCLGPKRKVIADAVSWLSDRHKVVPDAATSRLGRKRKVTPDAVSWLSDSHKVAPDAV